MPGLALAGSTAYVDYGSRAGSAVPASQVMPWETARSNWDPGAYTSMHPARPGDHDRLQQHTGYTPPMPQAMGPSPVLTWGHSTALWDFAQ